MNAVPSAAGARSTSAPPAILGLAPQLRRVLAGTDLTALGQELLAATAADPGDAAALLDLSILLQFKESRDLALAMQAEALAMQQHYRVRSGSDGALRVLAIVGPGDLMANTPVDCLLEESDVTLELLYTGPGLPLPLRPPPHDVALIAVGESDSARPLLEALESELADWPCPVLNRPQRIAALARDLAARMLRGRPGIDMPPVVRIGRDGLAALARGAASPQDLDPEMHYPVIVRPVGSHAGRRLSRCADAAAIDAYLDDAAEVREFYIAPYRDYRSADGRFRKYRIVLIQGRPFLCHLAVGDDWMVNYQNARMDDAALKRADEARAMAAFDLDFARRHRAALEAIHRCSGLDYVGIDCAESPDGRLLVFEIDNAMVIHGMDGGPEFAYKQTAMRRVFAAFEAMLTAAAAGPAPHGAAAP